MMKRAATIMLAALAGSAVPLTALAAEYLLYTPQPQESKPALPEKGKGVLVKKITIKSGDTLGKLSRSYSGRRSYFPQILLFNDIKNPDLIYAGKELFVPVGQQEAAAEAATPKTPTPAVRKKSGKAAAKEEKAEVTRPVEPRDAKPATRKGRKKAESAPAKSGADQGKGEQTTYMQALDDYHKGDYNSALKLFTRFLERYPSSALAPDAALYKAECLFKLSGE